MIMLFVVAFIHTAAAASSFVDWITSHRIASKIYDTHPSLFI